MILGTIRKILKEDLIRMGGEIPAWIDGILSPMNEFIDKATLALRNNLTFADNFLCKIVTIQLTHATAQSVAVPVSRKIVGLIPVLATKSTDTATATKNMITGSKIEAGGNGQATITVNFAGGAAVKADVTLIILLG